VELAFGRDGGATEKGGVNERRIVLALSIAIALTRLLAIAHSLFDWDEGLFSLGVRDYDVTDHRPHPPGYPLFILAAKAIALTGLDAFRSVQVVVVLGALFVFPAVYFLARELGFDFPTSAAGAAVYAFLPNVWIYGGTAFSDVPATTVVLFACALLLRGRRDARAYIAGAVLLGIAVGIRPANLLVGAVPALLATWAQVRAKSYRSVAAAMFLGAAIVAASYAGAALASRGVQDYIRMVQEQSKYVRDVDSWRNPGRPSLYEAAKLFILWPFWHKDVLNALAIGATMSAVWAIARRRTAPLLTLAIFTPLAVTSWLNLDIATTARYAIGYMAAHALLCADGFRLFGRKVQIALCTAMVLVFIGWTWPALRWQRTYDAPPAAALQWARANVPASTPLWVYDGFGPLSDYILAERRPHFFTEVEDIPLGAEGWVVDWRARDGGHDFVRPHPILWRVLRRRNFEASVSPANRLIRFGDGWYHTEGTGARAYRWMKKEGVVLLPSTRGPGTLSLRGELHDALPSPPTLEVRWNGQTVDRFTAPGSTVERSWTLTSRGDAPNELRIITSATLVPAQHGNSIDTRELGLRLDRLSWTPR
jgi:hypothetical protein